MALLGIIFVKPKISCHVIRLSLTTLWPCLGVHLFHRQVWLPSCIFEYILLLYIFGILFSDNHSFTSLLLHHTCLIMNHRIVGGVIHFDLRTSSLFFVGYYCSEFVLKMDRTVIRSSAREIIYKVCKRWLAELEARKNLSDLNMFIKELLKYLVKCGII